jgi:putative transposase
VIYQELEYMEEIMRDVRADFRAELAELNGEHDHVHLPVTYLPAVTLSRLVDSLTGVSSLRLRQKFPDLARHYRQANQLWSGPYLAGAAGGAPILSCDSTSSGARLVVTPGVGNVDDRDGHPDEQDHDGLRAGIA